MKSLVRYFVKKHLLANFILLGVFLGGIYFWNNTIKEQFPNVSFDVLRISVSYPGASPAEVEYFVTYPIEEAVRNLEGVKTVESTVGTGATSISLELDVRASEKAEVINNIKSVVLSLDLPDDIRNEPSFREFKTSQIAIVDILLYDETAKILSPEKRVYLQRIADALENQIINLPDVREVNKNGYLDEEIRIRLNPQALAKNRISVSTVLSELRRNNVRVPAGEMDDEQKSKLTLKAELATVEELQELIIQGNFSGNFLKLKELAEIYYGFVENTSMMKANGHEAIELRVIKSSNSGIIEAVEAIKQTIERFKTNQLQGTSVQVLLLDDESVSVSDRISLIVQNGLLGFVLILLLLFVFLDFKSGFWVAVGIPFTICFTLIAGSLLGLTINNITLAAIIVVMGMVVDDAIVVAENIARKKSSGIPSEEASVEGTFSVIQPVIASIITTCLAFVPLLLFSGRMSRINQSMPLVISLMLGASLLESMFILPGHLHLSLPFTKKNKKNAKVHKEHWFLKVEDIYGKIICKLLAYKKFVIIGFCLLLGVSLWMFRTQLQFVMFPNEETTEVFLSATVPEANTRMQTAMKSEEMEEIFDSYIGKDVIGVRTYISRGVRGRTGRDNIFRMVIELQPREKRERTTVELMSEWRETIKSLSGFERVNLSAQRFGQQSGSPLEIVILENDDLIRERIAKTILSELILIDGVRDAEIDEPIKNREYVLSLKRDQTKRMGISSEAVGSTLRSVLAGTRVYTLIFDNQEVDVNLTVKNDYQKDISGVLDVPVETNQGYLVPIKNIVNIQKQEIASSIERKQQKRLTKVFAGITRDSGRTPLDIAEEVEENVFPKIMSKYPGSYIYFGGEVQDSRESTNDFLFGIILVISLIYIVLALLFNSLGLPFIILMIVPFGVIGVVLAYFFHGIQLYGFFTMIGILGLTGVVVNDSIVMLSKLLETQNQKKRVLTDFEISKVVQTRLRAVLLTTMTTVAALFPTAYGVAGYDSMLSEMMLAMGWGLLFGTVITLILTPTIFSLSGWMRSKVFGKGL